MDQEEGTILGSLKKGAIMVEKILHGEEQNITGEKLETKFFSKEYNNPIISWVPSIGDWTNQFLFWRNLSRMERKFIVSATKYGLLLRLVLKDKKVINQEIILNQEIGRIRDFEVSHNGDIYIITDDENSSLWKLSKKFFNKFNYDSSSLLISTISSTESSSPVSKSTSSSTCVSISSSTGIHFLCFLQIYPIL